MHVLGLPDRRPSFYPLAMIFVLGIVQFVDKQGVLLMNKFMILSLLLMVFALPGCEAIHKFGESLKSIEMPKVRPKGDPQLKNVENEHSSSLLSVGGKDCPRVKAVNDLAAITQFSPPSDMVADKMISTTKLEKIVSKCSVSGNSVSVEMALDFTGVLGPIGVKDLDGQANYTYPYFLSVISPDGQILSKDVFALSMVYENGQITYHRQDKLRQVIPLMARQDPSQFQIMIGFQLSTDELAYNRRLNEGRR